jgi:hypothetical protein
MCICNLFLRGIQGVLLIWKNSVLQVSTQTFAVQNLSDRRGRCLYWFILESYGGRKCD